MKPYLILLIAAGLLCIATIRAWHDDPIVQFMTDGRPKRITYWNASPRLIHVDIEVKTPRICNDEARFESMNIYFFLSDFSWMETMSARYVKIVEM